MKEILIIGFILSLLGFGIHCETIEIETSKGPQELFVPETHEELREAYIDMAKLYIEERFDHEDSLNQIEDLFDQVDRAIALSRNATDLSQELVADLDKLQKALNMPIIFQMYVSLAVGKAFLYTQFLDGFYVGLNVTGVILEQLLISIEYNIPARIQIGVGWKLF